MTRRKRVLDMRSLLYVVMLFGLVSSLAATALGPSTLRFPIELLWDRLFWPLLRLMIFLGIGLLVGLAIEALGWAGHMAALARPLMRWGRLRDESGVAFSTAFVSGTLANTLLMTFHQEGRISRSEMLLTYLINSGLPVFLLHLPTTFFIILPLAREAGLLYLGISGAAALLRSSVLLICARSILNVRGSTRTSMGSTAPKERKKDTAAVLRRFRRRFSRIVLFTVPVYALVFLAGEWGFFDWLRDHAAGWVSVGLLPVESAGVVVFSLAAEFTAGVAAAGALLESGALTVPQAVLALVLGSIVAAPLRALRHQLPAHAGIFSPALGGRLLLISQSLRILSLIPILGLYVSLSG